MKHDLVRGLQARVAAWRYGNPASGLKVIAVAGPYGKTTVAMLLSELLQESGASVMVLTNQGSFINGTPINTGYDLSAEKLQQQLQRAKKQKIYYVILEVTEPLLAACVLPSLPIEMAIVTGDSPSAQSLLSQSVNSTVVPAGFLHGEVTVAPHQAISFGFEESAEAYITRMVERRKGTEIDVVVDHQTRVSAATYLIGKANALNVAAAISAAYVLAVKIDDFQEGIARLERVIGNYDQIETDGVYDAVVDRALSHESLELVLASAKNLKKRRLIVVADSTIDHESYQLIAKESDRAFAVTDGVELPGIDKATSIAAAVELAKRAAKKDDVLLLLGAEVGAIQPGGSSTAQQLFSTDSPRE